MIESASVSPRNVGRVLKEQRLNRGLGLREFSGETGIAPSTLSRLERGTTEDPTPAIKKKVADHLGLAVTDIWPVSFEEDV